VDNYSTSGSTRLVPYSRKRLVRLWVVEEWRKRWISAFNGWQVLNQWQPVQVWRTREEARYDQEQRHLTVEMASKGRKRDDKVRFRVREYRRHG
jgi:hypothetical protein